MPESIMLGFGSLLIQLLPGEDEEKSRLYFVELITEVYGKFPTWVKFNVGSQYEWQGMRYRVFLCPSGSVEGRIQLHISKSGGIERSIILRGTRSGKPCCSEIRFGVETEFDCTEIHQISEV